MLLRFGSHPDTMVLKMLAAALRRVRSAVGSALSGKPTSARYRAGQAEDREEQAERQAAATRSKRPGRPSKQQRPAVLALFDSTTSASSSKRPSKAQAGGGDMRGPGSPSSRKSAASTPERNSLASPRKSGRRSLIGSGGPTSPSVELNGAPAVEAGVPPALRPTASTVALLPLSASPQPAGRMEPSGDGLNLKPSAKPESAVVARAEGAPASPVKPPSALLQRPGYGGGFGVGSNDVLLESRRGSTVKRVSIAAQPLALREEQQQRPPPAAASSPGHPSRRSTGASAPSGMASASSPRRKSTAAAAEDRVNSGRRSIGGGPSPSGASASTRLSLPSPASHPPVAWNDPRLGGGGAGAAQRPRRSSAAGGGTNGRRAAPEIEARFERTLADAALGRRLSALAILLVYASWAVLVWSTLVYGRRAGSTP